MEQISLENWGRREAYAFFSGISDPFYSVTFALDVTGLYHYVKREGLSFYYALVFLSTQAVNETPAFLYLPKGEAVFRLERREPSFTDLKPGAEQFHVVTMPAGTDLAEFCHRARAASRAQTAFVNGASETEDLIYFTCLPWFDLTALTNERDFDKDDAIPRISWGKYTDRAGRKELHMSLEVNHRFIDGGHLGQFYENLQGKIAALEAETCG